jgi:hypothetical protein
VFYATLDSALDLTGSLRKWEMAGRVFTLR